MITRIGARRLLLFAAVAAVLSAFPATALAHAELTRAIPADGASVTEPVTIVSGRYSQDLTGNSRLEVKDPSGATVATGAVDPADHRRMVARPDAPLVDGTFTVESTAISAEDGDIERVTWTFTVGLTSPTKALPTATASPASAPPTTEPTPATTPSEAPSASPTPSADPGAPTSSTTDVLLPIIVALALVLVLAGFLLSRSRAGR